MQAQVAVVRVDILTLGVKRLLQAIGRVQMYQITAHLAHCPDTSCSLFSRTETDLPFIGPGTLTITQMGNMPLIAAGFGYKKARVGLRPKILKGNQQINLTWRQAG